MAAAKQLAGRGKGTASGKRGLWTGLAAPAEGRSRLLAAAKGVKSTQGLMACSATVLMVLELEAINREGFAHKLAVDTLPHCVAEYIAAGLTPSDPGQDPRLSFVELATCAADHRAVLVAVAKYDEATRRVKDSTFKQAEKDSDVAKQPTCVVWNEAFSAYRNAVSVLHPSLGLALGQHQQVVCQLLREYAETGIWLAFDVQQRTRASGMDVPEATLLLSGRSAADVSMLLSNPATKARMQPSTHRGRYSEQREREHDRERDRDRGAHRGGPREKEKEREREPRLPCKQFLSRGSCSYGDGCKFDHDKPRTPSGAAGSAPSGPNTNSAGSTQGAAPSAGDK